MGDVCTLSAVAVRGYVSAPAELRSGSPTQLLRQAFELWPYALIGVSVAGLAYLLLPAIR